jgi:hypothetical protein
MVDRLFDAELHNGIANLPEVKKWFGHVDGPIDLSPSAEAVDDYVFLADGPDAGSIFEWSGPGIWQAHYLFAPSHRGRRAIASALAMCRWMVAHMNATDLWGQTPLGNKAARWLNRQIGAVSFGQRNFEIDGPCELFRWRP